MEAGVRKLFDKSSYTAGEKQGLQITVGEVEESWQRGENCLIGKYWAERRYSKEAFKSVLSRLWQMEGRVTFKDLQENLLLLQFSDREDKIRVLEGCPWSFE